MRLGSILLTKRMEEKDLKEEGEEDEEEKNNSSYVCKMLTAHLSEAVP